MNKWMKDWRLPAKQGKSNEVSRVMRGKLDRGKAGTRHQKKKKKGIRHYHWTISPHISLLPGQVSLMCLFASSGQQVFMGHPELHQRVNCKPQPGSLKVKYLLSKRPCCPSHPIFWINWVMGVMTATSAHKTLTVEGPDLYPKWTVWFMYVQCLPLKTLSLKHLVLETSGASTKCQQAWDPVPWTHTGCW